VSTGNDTARDHRNAVLDPPGVVNQSRVCQLW
jgi:hypothetical protein